MSASSLKSHGESASHALVFEPSNFDSVDPFGGILLHKHEGYQSVQRICHGFFLFFNMVKGWSFHHGK